jgi:hypothetical protein
MHYKNLATAAVLAVAATVTHANAAPIVATSATVAPDNTLLTLTAGGTTYDTFLSPTFTDVSGDRVWESSLTDPGTDDATLTDLRLDTGILNHGTFDAQFGRVLTTSDAFFLIDIDSGRFDGAVLKPIDATGSPIGTLSVSIADDPTAPSLVSFGSLTRESGAASLTGFEARGYLFTLSDFMGTGDLSLATGLQLEDIAGDGNFDVSAIGIASVIPEPSSVLAGGVLGTLLLGRRRRVN